MKKIAATRLRARLTCLIAIAAVPIAIAGNPARAHAAVVERNLPSVLPGTDDGSSAAVNLAFPINFFGTVYNQVFVNNNGNITFDGPLSQFTPSGLAGTNRVIIAPFFADVDTRGGGVVRYG